MVVALVVSCGDRGGSIPEYDGVVEAMSKQCYLDINILDLRQIQIMKRIIAKAFSSNSYFVNSTKN